MGGGGGGRSVRHPRLIMLGDHLLPQAYVSAQCSIVLYTTPTRQSCNCKVVVCVCWGGGGEACVRACVCVCVWGGICVCFWCLSVCLSVSVCQSVRVSVFLCVPVSVCVLNTPKSEPNNTTVKRQLHLH